MMDTETLTPLDHRFPCNACGANMRYDPGARQLTCRHCGNTEPMPEADKSGTALRELDYNSAINAPLPETEIELTRVVSCDSCGAQFEFDPDTHAAECPFCASPVVSNTGTHRHIKPGGLLPFALDEVQAREAMKNWLGSLWFAPNGLKEYARKGRRMNGIYVPYWTFDAQTDSDYTGQRGTHYYVTRTVMRNGKATQVRERRTRWRAVSGRVARFFDDVLVLASTSLPQKHTDALEPWDLGEMKPYTPDYLAGFRAEGYQIDLQDGFVQARSKMDAVIAGDVRRDIGGDAQRISQVNTRLSDVTFKHVLLPVWLAAYKYRGQSYQFVVNGRTGRVQGERPYSYWKIAFAVLVGLILAGGFAFVIANGQ
jgi:DNA-directed RNA polymerase subunit RPC12/RpoP